MSRRIAQGFDLLAPVYDGLAHGVIGKGIKESQKYFLNRLPTEGTVLILGGGTGWILPVLVAMRPQLTIDYIELSEKMLQRAKAQHASDRIQFIQGTENDIPARKYDAVITNFYLDLFTDLTLPGVVHKIKASINDNAPWLVTDFIKTKRIHGMMLWIMYRFFRVVAAIEAKTLPAWPEILSKAGAGMEEEKIFSNGFIKTALFRF